MQKCLTKLFQTKTFKKIVFVLGALFLILSVGIAIKPDPFLKFGYWGVFLFNLFGPGTLLIPSLSRYMNIPLLSVVTALGMLLNDSISWIVGKNGEVILPPNKKVERVSKQIQGFGPYALFVWSFLPIPYDFIGLIAGYLKIPYKNFAIPTFFGRLTRLLLIGYGTINIISR